MPPSPAVMVSPSREVLAPVRVTTVRLLSVRVAAYSSLIFCAASAAGRVSSLPFKSPERVVPPPPPPPRTGSSRGVEGVGFGACKSSIDGHAGCNGEGNVSLFVGGGGVGGNGGGLVFAGFYPDLVAGGVGRGEGGLQVHGACPGAGAGVGAGGGHPKNGEVAHGDGLLHIGGGFIGGVAALRGGNRGGAGGQYFQNKTACAIVHDGCHRRGGAGVSDWQTGGCGGGEGYFDTYHACGGEGKVGGLCAFCSTFVGTQIYCAALFSGHAGEVNSEVVVGVVGGVVVEVGVVACVHGGTVCF